ncbi:MAG: hypothetical protein D3918_07325 [Candidatus Electrothrix sp. AX2]|nr:hypothetical protein [Candidatus Electrothrix gigas]
MFLQSISPWQSLQRAFFFFVTPSNPQGKNDSVPAIFRTSPTQKQKTKSLPAAHQPNRAEAVIAEAVLGIAEDEIDVPRVARAARIGRPGQDR